MEEVKEIFAVLISWPTAVIVAVLVLRSPIKMLIERLINSESGKAKVGPVEVELGKLAKEGKAAVNSLNRINVLMAESRLLELEITEGNFGPVFTPEQRAKMQEQINELRKLTNEAANKAN
ncbi:MAG: hypothetical protein AB2557_00010 [Candidatus Thiodiazotropha sp.]